MSCLKLKMEKPWISTDNSWRLAAPRNRSGISTPFLFIYFLCCFIFYFLFFLHRITETHANWWGGNNARHDRDGAWIECDSSFQSWKATLSVGIVATWEQLEALRRRAGASEHRRTTQLAGSQFLHIAKRKENAAWCIPPSIIMRKLLPCKSREVSAASALVSKLQPHGDKRCLCANPMWPSEAAPHLHRRPASISTLRFPVTDTWSSPLHLFLLPPIFSSSDATAAPSTYPALHYSSKCFNCIYLFICLGWPWILSLNSRTPSHFLRSLYISFSSLLLVMIPKYLTNMDQTEHDNKISFCSLIL